MSFCFVDKSSEREMKTVTTPSDSWPRRQTEGAEPGRWGGGVYLCCGVAHARCRPLQAHDGDHTENHQPGVWDPRRWVSKKKISQHRIKMCNVCVCVCLYIHVHIYLLTERKIDIYIYFCGNMSCNNNINNNNYLYIWRQKLMFYSPDLYVFNDDLVIFVSSWNLL